MDILAATLANITLQTAQMTVAVPTHSARFNTVNLMKNAFIFLAVGTCMAFPSLASAQFDIDGERWSGNTANTQAQGFDQGDPVRLTWGFAQEGINIPGFIGEGASPNELRDFFDTNIGPQATTWQPLFDQIYDRWNSVSGLDVQFEANDDGATFGAQSGGVLGVRADLRIAAHSVDGQAGSNTLAYNFFPNIGEMVIDSDNTAFFSDSSNNFVRLRNVLAHELGHGLGMEHLFSDAADQLLEPFINVGFDGPQYFDILTAQRGYGDFNEKGSNHLGNDTVALATDLGLLVEGTDIVIGQDAAQLAVAITDTDFFSIDDTSDTDVYEFNVDQDGVGSFILDALGFTLDIAEQAANGLPENEIDFNTQERSDLALEILDANGAVLASADAFGLGGSESLTDINLDAGTYFLRITGENNADANLLDTQFYGLSASFTVNAVPEPSSALIVALFGFVGLRRRRRTA